VHLSESIHISDYRNIDHKNHQNNSDKHNVALVSKEIAQNHYNDIYSIFTDEIENKYVIINLN